MSQSTAADRSTVPTAEPASGETTETAGAPGTLPAPDAAEAVEAAEGETTDDPAGGVALAGHNRVGAGVRVLAGLALGSGLVASLGELGGNTSVSII
ncbi:hypothetical protein [Streptomyces sp. NBRC 109706]|uniref:hypothetical protein n=1 Tax=Streptomyces sp. NBRC 109706 TaxID=1550035 RepID=UPI0007822D00|nr:hypothetical protein [Streptomyces sp. NBRC 109706]